MFQSGSTSDDDKRSEARIRRVKRVHLALVASYIYELAVLAGFCRAGYIQAAPIIGFAACALGLRGGRSLLAERDPPFPAIHLRSKVKRLNTPGA
jgi:hypothetical protein